MKDLEYANIKNETAPHEGGETPAVCPVCGKVPAKMDRHHDHGHDIIRRLEMFPRGKEIIPFLEARYKRFDEVKVCQECNGFDGKLKRSIIKGEYHKYFDYFSFSPVELRQIMNEGEHISSDIFILQLTEIQRMVASVLFVGQFYKRNSTLEFDVIVSVLDKIGRMSCDRVARILEEPKSFTPPSSSQKKTNRCASMFDKILLNCLIQGSQTPEMRCSCCSRSHIEASYVKQEGPRSDLIEGMHVLHDNGLIFCINCYDFWRLKTDEHRKSFGVGYKHFMAACGDMFSPDSPIFNAQGKIWSSDKERIEEILNASSARINEDSVLEHKDVFEEKIRAKRVARDEHEKRQKRLASLEMVRLFGAMSSNRGHFDALLVM